jgi:hypothetical protein
VFSVSALPAAPPAKFAIQITAPLRGAPASYYLKKSLNGDGTTNLADAAACSLADGKLTCEGQLVGTVNFGLPLEVMDMGTIAAVKPDEGISDGFSIDENLVLHLKSSKFSQLPEKQAIADKQGGEGQFALLDISTAGALIQDQAGEASAHSIKLFTQLGCPAGTHEGLHGELIVGKSKVVPL